MPKRRFNPDDYAPSDLGIQRAIDSGTDPSTFLFGRPPYSEVARAAIEGLVLRWIRELPKANRDALADWLSRYPTTDLTFDVLHHTVVGRYPAHEDKRLTETQREIIKVCADVEKMLLAKNRKYGDSALNPKRVFSKADAIEQIKVRIDDKLSRIESAQSDEDEDVIDDLIGYLVLLKVARMRGAKRQATRGPMCTPVEVKSPEQMRAMFGDHVRFDREIDARPSGRPEGKRKGR